MKNSELHPPKLKSDQHLLGKSISLSLSLVTELFEQQEMKRKILAGSRWPGRIFIVDKKVQALPSDALTSYSIPMQTALLLNSRKIPSGFLNYCHCYSSWRLMPSTLFLYFAVIYQLFKAQLKYVSHKQSAFPGHSLSSYQKWFLPLVKF